MKFIIRFICMFIPVKSLRRRTRSALNNHWKKQRDKTSKFLRSVMPGRKKFDLIVPIGDRCQISFQMRQNNLQFKSYPFDWLLNGSLDALITLLNNDFAHFLDRQDMEPVERRPVNLVVKNNHTGYWHLHDFECDTIDEDYQSVYEKYIRRFARFDRHISNAKTVLFVYRNDSVRPDDIRKLIAVLKKRYPCTKITLLWITANTEKQTITPVFHGDGIIHTEFDCDTFYGEWETSKWEGNWNLYKKLFNKYALTLRGYFAENTKE